ncbi:hypothetical protein WJX73_002336 [Symbiochloris irregularis]|uniref:ABM domain-containing protein n=1 Tax=Symbiochloris irregularis TaxID=706552 RepID=A0AAW1PRN3_9CHLO
MKSAICLIAFVAFAGVLSVDASARFDGTSVSIDSSLAEVWNNIVTHSSSAVERHSDEPRKATVLIEYAVLPPVQEKFVSYFEKLQEATEKEEGVIVFGLSRTVDENLTFYLYSEWDTQKTYASHYQKEATKEFLESISKIGVIYKIHILDQISFSKPGSE